MNGTNNIFNALNTCLIKKQKKSLTNAYNYKRTAYIVNIKQFDFCSLHNIKIH